jgi:hypothetical protein
MAWVDVLFLMNQARLSKTQDDSVSLEHRSRAIPCVHSCRIVSEGGKVLGVDHHVGVGALDSHTGRDTPK